MLLVRTYLSPSHIHGTGIYASEPIPKGTLIWEDVPGFDMTFTPEMEKKLREIPEADHFLRWYAWRDAHTGLLRCSLDNERFMNHSDTPNTVSSFSIKEGWQMWAARDIDACEELTGDYSTFRQDEADRPSPYVHNKGRA